MENRPAPGTNRPVWDAEATHPEMCNQLKKAFSEVLDPELGLNIIQLGLIRNIKVMDDNVIIKMILTTPFCPYGPSMLESTRLKAESALGKETVIDFGMEPWDFSMMEEGLGNDWGLF